MSLNLTKSNLRIDAAVGTASIQVICKAVMQLPEDKPDIERILAAKAEASVSPDGITVLDGRVAVRGMVRFEAPYVASYDLAEYVGDREPLRFFACSDPTFEAELPIAGVELGMGAVVDAEVDSFEVDVAGPRSLSLTAIVKVASRATASAAASVVTDVADVEAGRVEVAKRSIFVESKVGLSSSQFTIRDAFQIPEGKPDIGQLLDYSAMVAIGPDGLRAGPSRVNASGTLDLRIAYIGDLDEKPYVFLAGPQIDFNTVVDLPGATEANRAKAKGLLESLTLTKVGSRTLQVEALVRVDAEATAVNELSAVVDIAARGDDIVDVQRSRLLIQSLVAHMVTPSTVSETFAVGSGRPNIDEVFISSAKAHIIEARVTPDKVTLSGEIDVYVTYAGAVEEEGELAPIESAQQLGLPFEVSIDAPGVEAGMSIEANCDVLDVEGIKAGPRAIDVDIRLSSSIRVTEDVDLDVISDAALIAPAGLGAVPSRRITIYIVQSGDTLWTIARRYGKPMAKIADANSLSGGEIYAGQKVLIPA